MLDWYNKGAFLEYDPMSKMFMSFFYGDPNIIYSIFGKDTDQFNAVSILQNHLKISMKEFVLYCAIISETFPHNFETFSCRNFG